MIVKTRESRWKNLWITPELMMSFIPPTLWRHENGTVDVHSMKGIPNDVEVCAVFYSEFRNAFCFRLWHPSFDILAECQAIPEIVGEISVERLRLADVPESNRGREFI